jgi:hypothetical protein
MTKDLGIITLGIFIALLPFLGLPHAWDTALLVLSGLSVATLTFLLRRDFFFYVERLRRRSRERTADTYVENGIQSEPTFSENIPPTRGRKLHVPSVE